MEFYGKDIEVNEEQTFTWGDVVIAYSSIIPLYIDNPLILLSPLNGRTGYVSNKTTEGFTIKLHSAGDNSNRGLFDICIKALETI